MRGQNQVKPVTDSVNKKSLSERDICTKFITPAIEQAGWNIQTQVREEVYFTDGRIYVRGSSTARGKRKYADYILYYRPNIPIAVIEAKDNEHSISSGIQQALEYGDVLQIPFVFSSNGDGFLFHDSTGSSPQVEQELGLDQFPSPEDLWRRYCQWKGMDDWKSDILAQDYHVDASGTIQYAVVKYRHVGAYA